MSNLTLLCRRCTAACQLTLSASTRWCIVKTNLLIAADIRKMNSSDPYLQILLNKELISISQVSVEPPDWFKLPPDFHRAEENVLNCSSDYWIGLMVSQFALVTV